MAEFDQKSYGKVNQKCLKSYGKVNENENENIGKVDREEKLPMNTGCSILNSAN